MIQSESTTYFIGTLFYTKPKSVCLCIRPPLIWNLYIQSSSVKWLQNNLISKYSSLLISGSLQLFCEGLSRCWLNNICSSLLKLNNKYFRLLNINHFTVVNIKHIELQMNYSLTFFRYRSSTFAQQTSKHKWKLCIISFPCHRTMYVKQMLSKVGHSLHLLNASW